MPGPGGGALPTITLPCLGGGTSVDLSTLKGPLVLSLWQAGCAPCREGDAGAAGLRRPVRRAGAGPGHRLRRPATPAPRSRRPASARSPTRRWRIPAVTSRASTSSRRSRGMPTIVLRRRRRQDRLPAVRRRRLGRRGGRPGPRAPRSRSLTPDLPDWLRPVEEAARSITVHDLTRFMPPGGRGAPRERRADALRRGPGGARRCCSPSAATPCAPTPARSPSPAARSTRVRPLGRPRCARRRRRPASTRRASRCSPSCRRSGFPPSNFSVTPVLAWWREPSAVHAVSAGRGARGLPGADQRAARPAHRITVTMPGGWRSPGLPDRRRPRRHLLGLHRRA